MSHELAEDLLVAADKYDMPRLRCYCENVLINGLTTDNVAETLVFADCYSFRRLRSIAADFLQENFNQVETTDGWCQLMETYPQLADQIRSRGGSTKRQADTDNSDDTKEISTKRARLS
jgi:speckle-type POZ protein